VVTIGPINDASIGCLNGLGRLQSEACRLRVPVSSGAAQGGSRSRGASCAAPDGWDRAPTIPEVPRRIGDVELNRFHAAVGRGHRLDMAAPATRDDDLGAELVQGLGEPAADIQPAGK
jgi:hypothetical protein